MNRLNQILAGVLAVQLVVAIVILWPRPAASGEGESLFPGVEAGRIVEVTITSADGKSIHLAKQGSDWALPEADDYPAQADQVTPLLTKIAELKADQVVTQTGSSHKRLKVADDDFERRIDLKLDDGSQHHLYLGTSPSYGTTHVRAGDQDEVYLTAALATQDAAVDATAWTNRTYLSVPQEELVALTLENASGRLELERDGETWALKGLVAGETLDENQAQALISRATSIALLRPLGKEEKEAYGLQEPSATVILQTRSDAGDEKTYILRVGAQDPEDKSYIVISSESPYYVRVSEFSVKDLVEKARDGLLVPPPTPEPPLEATPASP